MKVAATWGSSRRKSGVSVAIITLIDIIFTHHNFNSGLNGHVSSKLIWEKKVGFRINCK